MVKIILIEKTVRQLLGRSLPTHREILLITGLLRKGINTLEEKIKRD